MDDKSVENLRVIENTQEMRSKEEVSANARFSRQTNPIVRKLLKFGLSESANKFSVKDLFLR